MFSTFWTGASIIFDVSIIISEFMAAETVGGNGVFVGAEVSVGIGVTSVVGVALVPHASEAIKSIASISKGIRCRVLCLMFIFKDPSFRARGLTVWLSGSGGSWLNNLYVCANSCKPRSPQKRHSRCPLPPGFNGGFMLRLFSPFHKLID